MIIQFLIDFVSFPEISSPKKETFLCTFVIVTMPVHVMHIHDARSLVNGARTRSIWKVLGELVPFGCAESYLIYFMIMVCCFPSAWIGFNSESSAQVFESLLKNQN